MDELKDIIVEFITKTQGLAYNNYAGVCIFCGGGRKNNMDGTWKPSHSKTCLYTRAENSIAGPENTCDGYWELDGTTYCRTGECMGEEQF